jgi:hypothetical protein
VHGRWPQGCLSPKLHAITELFTDVPWATLRHSSLWWPYSKLQYHSSCHAVPQMSGGFSCEHPIRVSCNAQYFFLSTWPLHITSKDLLYRAYILLLIIIFCLQQRTDLNITRSVVFFLIIFIYFVVQVTTWALRFVQRRISTEFEGEKKSKQWHNSKYICTYI